MIPNLVGESLADARLRLKKLKIEPQISWSAAKQATGHDPRAAAARRVSPRRPGMQIELVVARSAYGAR